MAARTIIERKRRLDGTFVDFRCDRLLIEPDRRAVLRYVIPRERRLEGTDLVLVPGTVTIAHYWSDRPYNVYHWLDRGRTLGYYCNVAEATTISEEEVSYTDLVVDVLIDPTGITTVLDEEELPTDLPAPLRATVSRALDQVTGQSKRIAAEIERESRRYV